MKEIPVIFPYSFNEPSPNCVNVSRTWDPLPSSLENLSFREKSHDHDVDPLSRTVGPHAIKKPKSPSPIKKLAFTKEKWRWEEEAHAILSVWVEWKGRGSIGKEERRGDRIGRSGAINVARNSWRGGRSSRVRATPRMSVLPWSPWPTDLYYTRVQVPHIRVSTRNTDRCSSPVPWRVEQRARPLGPSRLSLLVRERCTGLGLEVRYESLRGGGGGRSIIVRRKGAKGSDRVCGWIWTEETRDGGVCGGGERWSRREGSWMRARAVSGAAFWRR